MSIRTEQIGNVIKREVSQLFAEVLDESEYGLVTVTRVMVLPDLSEARIFVTALKKAEDFVAMLQKRRGYVRRTVSPRLRFKKTPKFLFLLDTTVAESERIEQMLNDSSF